MNLFKASNQWATRPPDERFGSLEEMRVATAGYAATAKEYEMTPAALKVQSLGDELVLTGQSGRHARLTHWAMGQLASRAGAPADYLRSLPAEMAQTNLQYGLMRRAVEGENKPLKLLMHSNGELLLRAVTGMAYQRYWNHRIVEGLQGLELAGWQVPPARPAFDGQPGTRVATAEDVLPGEQWGLSIKEGDLIAPAGLYASDHDMFAFMVNQQVAIPSPTRPDVPLYRGFFVEHSEVGDSSYWVWLFYYEQVCGNHIVWNASGTKAIRIPHIGETALERIEASLQVQLKEYASQTGLYDEQRLKGLATKELGGSKAEVVELLFNRRLLTKTVAERAYDTCEAEQTPIDGSNPRTPWGIAQGLTRLSQGAQYADQRNVLDKAAGKVLEVF